MQNVGSLVSLEALTRHSLTLTYAANRSDDNATQAADENKARKAQQPPEALLDGPRKGRRKGHNQANQAANQHQLTDEQRARRKARRAARQADAQANAQANAPARMTYEKREGTSLKIRTQDGDLVKLKFSVTDKAKIDVNADNGKSLGELNLSSSVNQKLSISVRGELSDEETKAIRAVIDQAGELAEDFFSNDIQGAFETASAFQVDGGQLARVNLNMHVRERVTYSPGNAPAAQPALQSESKNAQQQSAAAADTTAAGDKADVDTTAAVQAEPVAAEQADEAPVENPVPENPATQQNSLFDALSSINQFLQRLLDRLDYGAESADAEPESEQQPTLDFSFKIEIFGSIVQGSLDANRIQAAEPVDVDDENADGADDTETNGQPTLFEQTMATLLSERMLSFDAIA